MDSKTLVQAVVFIIAMFIVAGLRGGFTVGNLLFGALIASGAAALVGSLFNTEQAPPK